MTAERIVTHHTQTHGMVKLVHLLSRYMQRPILQAHSCVTRMPDMYDGHET